ncbi:MAG: efflux RND transporter periplasmic adaptor subunit [Epsilonproteobacteria bacterium]|nr:efflux RND transporter periplasmic adaptor subunit [Campylobacterota bacterium]
MIKKIVFSMVLIGIITGTMYLIFKPEKEKKTLFHTQQPQRRNLVQYVNSSGNLEAKDHITIGPLVPGIVQELLVDDNDIVKKGQVLAIIDNGVGDSAMNKAKAFHDQAIAQLEYQKAFYERQKALYEAGQLAKDQFDKFTQDYTVAQARVREAFYAYEVEKKTYENLFIKSPDDGTVIARKVDLGEGVTAIISTTVLFKIATNLKKMEARIDVDEADIGMIQEGQEAIFSVDAFPKEVFHAKVVQIQYQAKIVENVVTFATKLDVENPDLKLRPGMTTNVDIKVSEQTNALTIPNKTLRINYLTLKDICKKENITLKKHKHYVDHSKQITRSKVATEHKDFVWLFKEPENTIEQVEVLLGINDGRYTHVLKGLTENDHIITRIDETNNNANVVLDRIFSKPGSIGR